MKASVVLLVAAAVLTPVLCTVSDNDDAVDESDAALKDSEAELSGKAREVNARFKKLVNRRSNKQLKEMLNAVGVPVPEGADKEDLRSLMAKHNVLVRYGKLHPEKGWHVDVKPGERLNDVSDLAKGLFKLFDHNGDKQLSRDEMDELLHNDILRKSKTIDFTKDIFTQFDLDGSGHISEQEASTFLTMAVQIGQQKYAPPEPPPPHPSDS